MSDMTLAEAVNECGKWGNLLRALGKVSDVAAFAAGQEQLKVERERALDAMKAELETLTANVAKAKAEATDARGAAKQLIDQAKADAAKLVADARAVTTAASQDLAKAQGAAEQATNAAKADMNAASVVRDGLLAEIAQLRTKLDTIKSEARAAFGGA